MPKYSDEVLKVRADIVLATQDPKHPRHAIFQEFMMMMSLITGLSHTTILTKIKELTN